MRRNPELQRRGGRATVVGRADGRGAGDLHQRRAQAPMAGEEGDVSSSRHLAPRRVRPTSAGAPRNRGRPSAASAIGAGNRFVADRRLGGNAGPLRGPTSWHPGGQTSLCGGMDSSPRPGPATPRTRRCLRTRRSRYRYPVARRLLFTITASSPRVALAGTSKRNSLAGSTVACMNGHEQRREGGALVEVGSRPASAPPLHSAAVTSVPTKVLSA